jgi:RNA polymerase sigma-70 factor (ECF subfamily)
VVDDKLVFEEIYTSFHSKIYCYVTRLVGKCEAEDVTQEVFIKAEKALKTFRNESQLSTWLYRIATNAAIDRIRTPSFHQKSAKEQTECSLLEAGHTDIAGKNVGVLSKAFSIEEQIIHKEMNECIRGVIEQLPENYRMVVILSALEGLQNKEIAEILEVSLDVVKARLHRGKARLKIELLNYCNFSWDERNELTCDTKDPIKK